MIKPIFAVTFFLSGYFLCAFSQSNQDKYFREILLKIDSSEYSLTNNSIRKAKDTQISFKYAKEDEVCEVDLFPHSDSKIKGIKIIPSGDYELIDSLLYVNNELYRFKVRFNQLSSTEFLKFTFSITELTDSSRIYEIRLFPYTQTTVKLFTANDELFIGEEKIFELTSNNIENIKPVIDWVSYGDLDYRISSRFGQLRLHILPKSLGEKYLNLQLETVKPFIDSAGRLSTSLPRIIQKFQVKQSRLRFLNMDRQDVTLDDQSRSAGIEVQMDNPGGMELLKTYRIENQEEPGGGLIAELFTKSLITNNRILCILRPYNYHRESDGYLFIKDGDKAKYISNFSITPTTTINRISLLREGIDWTTNLNVAPGEIVDVRIEGLSLNKGSFRFEDVEDLTADTALKNENFIMYKLRIPMSISKRRVELFNHGKPTGHALTVREYQEARDFDYLSLNYGTGDLIVSQITGLLMSPKTIRDIVIDFNRNLIDGPSKLYGKQYLKISVKITGRNNELIELRDIENIVVVPGEHSPRSVNYDRKDETTTAVSFNKYLRKKTYDLEDWAKIEIGIENSKEKYSGKTFRRDIEIYVQKLSTFDIDVSFPAGLLINTFGKEENSSSQYQAFGGVSMAMIAQFSFYDQERPGKFKPYRLGAGFIALNAFNLSNAPDKEAGRDMGVVVIGSISPTRRDLKLSFPLYVGGGYKLNEKKWFILLGPGIRVRL